jgi:hypothetical protein
MRIQKPVAINDAHFESVIAELEALRIEEYRLIRLYRRLHRDPMQTTRFLTDLADLRDRTDRLDALLDPIPQAQERHIAQAVCAQLEQPCA